MSRSWFSLSETCMLKDALRYLKQLSLYLQSNVATAVRASCHIGAIKFKFLVLILLKQVNGRTLEKFVAIFDDARHYKSVDIFQAPDDEEKFKV